MKPFKTIENRQNSKNAATSSSRLVFGAMAISDITWGLADVFLCNGCLTGVTVPKFQSRNRPGPAAANSDS